MQIITSSDLPERLRGHELAALLIEGANSKAVRVAPCLATSQDAGILAEAKLILLGAVTRWADSGSGAVTQQTAGPFSVSVDTSQKARGYALWPSEITALQELCSTGEVSAAPAFSFTPSGGAASTHRPWCSLMFRATYCSCGADIAGAPIYEAGA